MKHALLYYLPLFARGPQTVLGHMSCQRKKTNAFSLRPIGCLLMTHSRPAGSQRASQSLLAFQSPQHKLIVMGHKIQNMSTAHPTNQERIKAEIHSSSSKNVFFPEIQVQKTESTNPLAILYTTF